MFSTRDIYCVSIVCVHCVCVCILCVCVHVGLCICRSCVCACALMHAYTCVPVCISLCAYMHVLCFVFLNILHNGQQPFKVSIIINFLKFQMGICLDILLFNMFGNQLTIHNSMHVFHITAVIIWYVISTKELGCPAITSISFASIVN